MPQITELTDQQLKDLLNDPRLQNSDLDLLSPNERARLQAMGAETTTPRSPLAPRGGDKNFKLNEEDLKALIGTGAKLGEVGAGFLPTPFNIPASMAAGTVAALANDESSVDRALFNGGLGAAGLGMERAFPMLGLLTGQLTGGKVGNLVKDARAFLRERGRGLGNGLPLGAPTRTGERLANVGKELEAAETASPVTVDLNDLRQSPHLSRVKDAQINTSNPIDNRAFARNENREFVNNQITARGGNPNMTMREAGELKRAQAASGEKIIKAKQNKDAVASITAKQDIQAQNEAARAQVLKDIQEAFDPSITPINRRLADLHTMQNTNNQLASKGRTLAKLGTMGIRGGVGAGLGSGLAWASGGDPLTGAKVGGLAGPFMSPANLSRAGYALGRIGETAPRATAITDIITDLLHDMGLLDQPDLINMTEKQDAEGNKVPNVQRRRPK